MNKPNEWESFIKAAKEIENDYYLEVEKVKKLTAEVALLRREKESLIKEFRAEVDKLRLETEQLRSVYPIQDLLSAKRVEVERMKKALHNVPRNHPERTAIESMVKAHIVERDQLQNVLEQAEKKFEKHLRRLNGMNQVLDGDLPEAPTKKERPPQPTVRIPEF